MAGLPKGRKLPKGAAKPVRKAPEGRKRVEDSADLFGDIEVEKAVKPVKPKPISKKAKPRGSWGWEG